MDARVSVSEETIKKAENISTQRKGELRLERLKEIAESGELQKCMNRFDVAKACGYTEKQKPAGYAWVYSLIKNGKLIERLSRCNPNGNKAEYEYSLGNAKLEPTKHLEEKTPEYEWVEKKEEKKEEERAVSMYGVGATVTMVAVKVGEMSIEITGAPVDYAKAIIETIIKK